MINLESGEVLIEAGDQIDQTKLDQNEGWIVGGVEGGETWKIENLQRNYIQNACREFSKDDEGSWHSFESILEALKKSRHKILPIYSQPASIARRGQKVISSFVEKYARKFSIKIRTPKILDLKEYDFLFSLKPDFVIVVAYGKIIPKKFLEIPKYGFINVHASLLPKWRGAAPIQLSLIKI